MVAGIDSLSLHLEHICGDTFDLERTLYEVIDCAVALWVPFNIAILMNHDESPDG